MNDARDIARRHHTVSRFYLNGFAATKKKSKLLVLDAVTRKHFRTAPTNVAVERDFNRIDIDGFDPGTLEQEFANFESDVAAAITRTIATKKFSSDADRNLITAFITMLFVRNPYLRGRMAEFMEDVMKKTVQIITSKEEIWTQQQKKMIAEGYISASSEIDYEAIKDFVRRDEYDVRLRREYYISQELNLMRKMPDYVARRNWVVLKASSDSGGFLTSDHPVTLAWSEPKKNGTFYSPGLGLSGTSVTFPLSPELGLLGAFEAQPDVLEVGPEIVAAFNGGTILMARRHVFARDEQASYLLAGDKKPKSCMALLSDPHFLPSKNPRRPWY